MLLLFSLIIAHLDKLSHVFNFKSYSRLIRGRNRFHYTLLLLDVYYVAFGVKNSYGKDIYLSTSMQAPHNYIKIPKDQQIQRTVVLLNQNLVNIHALDDATKQPIKIDNQDYITLTPSRSKPTTLRVYHVPSEGKLYVNGVTVTCKVMQILEFQEFCALSQISLNL